jgi:hypothetical protein
MTDAQEKMLIDLDKKVDSIIETLGGNKLGTKGLSNELVDLHNEFHLHVEDNRKNFTNLYKYKNKLTGALTIIGIIWSVCTAYIIKLLIG